MAVLVIDPHREDQLRAERTASGADRFDEVWEGVYVMAPIADNEHQDIQTAFGAALKNALGWNSGAHVFNGVNVSDREAGWESNYRIPDVAVILPGGLARNCQTHWVGGPDFIIEIISRSDRSREKIVFYEQLQVRELMLVDRNPWALELYGLEDGRLLRAGDSTVASQMPVRSRVLSVVFTLVGGALRPQIAVGTADESDQWVI